MPQNAFFPQTHDLLVSRKTTQRHFFPTLHPLSPIIFATATVVAFVLFRNSRFSFHCYTQREATPTQKSARKWRCDRSRLLARKITKSIHSCKPASLNRPIRAHCQQYGWESESLLMVSANSCRMSDCMTVGMNEWLKRDVFVMGTRSLPLLSISRE